MWSELGFSGNPFDTHPIAASERGRTLLVGRAKEIRKFENRIKNFDTIVCLEGQNGVGKTSLALVGGYNLTKETCNLQRDSIVLLDLPFQISSEESALDFKRKVYGKIASFFIANEKNLRAQLGLQFNLKPLEAWLENPIFSQMSGSIGGFGGGASRTPNQSSGFDNHGFFNIVDNLLNRAFTPKGGIICILDNLEILNTSRAARESLEEMRDDILSAYGIKWVVCGARGIVRSVASSARLQGRMQEPIELDPLSEEAISELLKSRIDVFKINKNANSPVQESTFRSLYRVLNSNLRDTLKFSSDYCMWLYEEDMLEDRANYYELFEIWLAEQATKINEFARLTPRSEQLFDDLCDWGGMASPSDFVVFDFKSTQAMRAQISTLENYDLVYSEVDETDNRRRSITVTPKGWLLRYHRKGYE